jgi:hypothetical protein
MAHARRERLIKKVGKMWLEVMNFMAIIPSAQALL